MSAAIWFRPYTLEQIGFFRDSLPKHLGIEFTEIGADFLRGRMPVDERTRQPFGILHVGAISDGFVIGTARPHHVGRRSHVWEIRITDEQERLVCISRLTMFVLEKS